MPGTWPLASRLEAGRHRVAPLVFAALMATGCSLFGQPRAAGPSPAPTPAVTAASGVDEVISSPAGTPPDSGRSTAVGSGETLPGTVLRFGEPAVIAIESGGRRGTVETTVVDITTGDPSDLDGLGLGGRVAGQVPYYVTIEIKNLSEADMPFTALDSDFHGKLDDGTPAGEVGTIDGFNMCESSPSPADFFEGKTFETCRIFIASNGTRVNSVAYEGFESPYAEDPIVWR
jgi:hypothetical protein